MPSIPCRLLPLSLVAVIISTVRSQSTLHPVNLTVVDRLPDAVKLSWDIESSNGPGPVDVRTHMVQYRREIEAESEVSVENPLHWVDHTVPIPVVSRMPTPEIQEITTLVDEESTISSGKFWLKLDLRPAGRTVPYHQLESSLVSGPISFDASTDEFENAIRQIEGIKSVRTFRYEVGHYGTSVLPSRGRYSWRVEFDVAIGPIPLFQLYKENLDGKYSESYSRVSIRRLMKARPIEYFSKLSAHVGNLDSATRYEFRVGVGNRSNGKEDIWSEISPARTKPYIPDLPVDKGSTKQLNSKHVKMISGHGRSAGNNEDPDYVPSAGMGGFDGHDGSDGLVVIIPYGKDDLIIPSRIYFYYTGEVQYFTVGNPYGDVDGNTQATSFIDIKCWGGGGSGGGSPIDIMCKCKYLIDSILIWYL